MSVIISLYSSGPRCVVGDTINCPSPCHSRVCRHPYNGISQCACIFTGTEYASTLFTKHSLSTTITHSLPTFFQNSPFMLTLTPCGSAQQLGSNRSMPQHVCHITYSLSTCFPYYASTHLIYMFLPLLSLSVSSFSTSMISVFCHCHLLPHSPISVPSSCRVHRLSPHMS